MAPRKDGDLYICKTVVVEKSSGASKLVGVATLRIEAPEDADLDTIIALVILTHTAHYPRNIAAEALGISARTIHNRIIAPMSEKHKAALARAHAFMRQRRLDDYR
jgi:hypothetical protein